MQFNKVFLSVVSLVLFTLFSLIFQSHPQISLLGQLTNKKEQHLTIFVVFVPHHLSYAGIQYYFDKTRYTYTHHSSFYECRGPGCRVVLVDSRQFSAACINALGYLPSHYSLLSPWLSKSSVRQTARGAFRSYHQHKVEEKNPLDVQLPDN